MNRILLFTMLLLTSDLLVKGQGMVCTVCSGEDTVIATREGSGNAFYLEFKAKIIWGKKGPSTKILVGKNLSRELAIAEYKNALGIEISKRSAGKTASGIIRFIDQFCQQKVKTFFDMPVEEVPTALANIQLQRGYYLDLIKQGDFFLISLLGKDPPIDILKWDNANHRYEYELAALNDPDVQTAISDILFLKNKCCKLDAPDLLLRADAGGGYELIVGYKKGKLSATKIILPPDRANGMIGVSNERPGHIVSDRNKAFAVKPSTDKQLSHQISYSENLKQLETRSADAMYIESIRQKINLPCAGCMVADNETLLIYDHKCGKLLYKKAGDSRIAVLTDINDLKLQYKKPFRIKVVNFNRYLYNLNFATSDIAFTSSESAVMQQYLIAGTNNGQISPTNTYTNGGTMNAGDYIYSSISAFKASIDVILSRINSFYLPIYTQRQMARLEKLGDSLAKHTRLKIDLSQMDSINGVGQAMIELANTQVKRDSTLRNDTVAIRKRIHLRQYDSLVRVIIDQNKSKPRDIARDTTAFKALTQHFHDSLSQSISTDSLVLNKRDSVLKEARVLRDKFLDLGRYCDSFIDNRIYAYSLCTDSFNCCASPQETYAHFDNMVNNISRQIYFVKWAKMIYDSITAAPPKPPTVTTGGQQQQPKADDSVKATILAISTSDLKFKNGNISGISLHLTPDTTKPAKAATAPDPFAAIDSLWFSFEKSIPTDYVMRQIIFRNNLISGNMSYTSPPIFPYGDRFGLVLQMPVADSVKRMGTMPSSTVTMSADLTVVGRALFSFSAGTFFGFGLNNDTYEWQQVPALGSNTVQSSSPYQLVKTGSGSNPIGAVGLANVTWPWPSGLF
ncbi:MAG TPA: hypothetical protein VNV35_00130, partial [Puia sp.]|nr:hypothetical protein [Puia sp.]